MLFYTKKAQNNAKRVDLQQHKLHYQTFYNQRLIKGNTP